METRTSWSQLHKPGSTINFWSQNKTIVGSIHGKRATAYGCVTHQLPRTLLLKKRLGGLPDTTNGPHPGVLTGQEGARIADFGSRGGSSDVLSRARLGADHVADDKQGDPKIPVPPISMTTSVNDLTDREHRKPWHGSLRRVALLPLGLRLLRRTTNRKPGVGSTIISHVPIVSKEAENPSANAKHAHPTHKPATLLQRNAS